MLWTTKIVLMASALAIAVPLATTAIAQMDASEFSETALDTTRPVEERLQALRELARTDNSAYVEALSTLIEGSDRFALQAAISLVDLVVMLGGHAPHEMPMESDAPRHNMGLVTDVNTILREHVLHPLPEVREVVVSYLVGRGDEETLDKIRSAEEKGELPREEALTYYMTAPPQIGNIDLRRYAEGDEEELAQRAIGVLASDTTQQLYLRDQILLNGEVSEARREEALGGLAKYDASFPSYATQQEVLDFALEVEQVPGTASSGTALIVNTVDKEIRENPALKDFYQRRFEEASEALSNGPDSWKGQTITQEIIEKF